MSTGHSKNKEDLKALIRSVPDFPKPGIVFRDITPLLADAAGLRDIFKLMAAQVREELGSSSIDAVAGMEARGFLIGVGLALEFNVGFVMLRKPSKLPGERHSVSYGKEYGEDVIEVATGAIQPDQRVLIVDDLLATGGTALAACQLVEKAGGRVAACSFTIELGGLPGRTRITEAGHRVVSLLIFD